MVEPVEIDMSEVESAGFIKYDLLYDTLSQTDSPTHYPENESESTHYRMSEIRPLS